MPERFAVVLIAPHGDTDAAAVGRSLRGRTVDLVSSGDSITFVEDDDVTQIPVGATAVAIFFGRGTATPPQTRAVADCLRLNVPVFPVVGDLGRFQSLVPAALNPFNGFQMAGGGDPDELAGLVLETLGLQRGRRKIFISYARADSAEMATQLREALTGRWYTPFQDTISIRPGRLFQAELMQELTDSDVFLLLNSPLVKFRPYVQKEITFAMQAGLGGLQLVWPQVEPRRDAFFPVMDLVTPGILDTDGTLSAAGLAEVLRRVAGERTVFQAQREHEMEAAVRAYASAYGFAVTAHMGRYFELAKPGAVLRLDVALGLPTSVELQRAVRDPRAYVVYDPLGITSGAADHLAFLAKRYPLTLLDMRESLRWPNLS